MFNYPLNFEEKLCLACTATELSESHTDSLTGDSPIAQAAFGDGLKIC